MAASVNVNTAGVEELMTVKHVGRVSAEAIVARREELMVPLELADIQQIPSLSGHWRELTDSGALIFHDPHRLDEHATENVPALQEMVARLQTQCDSLEKHVETLTNEQADGHREFIWGQEKLLCVQGQQDERLTDLTRTVKSVDLGLANLTYEWHQWQELQTKFQAEHMKLLQNFITSLQGIPNVQSASSRALLNRQHTLSLGGLMMSLTNMRHRIHLVRVRQGVDILSRNQCSVILDLRWNHTHCLVLEGALRTVASGML